ncbi:MAG: hypothetical protein ISN29_07750 [Gammaproteobacteria bacterium AqS3]|nr:hypothetical protein [Gammaproteobacteria bacterium AqS3]
MPVSPKTRTLISLALVIGITAMLVTSLMMYLMPYDRTTAAVHTIFGISLLALIGFHGRNNLAALGSYFIQGRRWLWTNLAGGTVILLGTLLWLPPFSSIIETGENIRRSNSIEAGRYDLIATHQRDAGVPVRILVRAGAHYTSQPIEVFGGLITFVTVPQMALWVEDGEGRFLKTLYLTSKAADSSYQSVDIFSDEIVRRPEALPIWSHRRGVRAADGLFMPLPDQPAGDATTAATPVADYELSSVLPEGAGELTLYMEVNRSFDFNEFWHRDKFPDDPVYTGGGNSGQPSLLYSLRLGALGGETLHRFARMDLIGRGHHSGADGEVYPLEGFSTALQLISVALVEINPPAPMPLAAADRAN